MLMPVKVDPVDWFRVIQDLLDLHFSLPQISAATGIPRSTLRDWRNLITTKPSHDDGEVLISLWSSVTQRQYAELPRIQKLAGFRHRNSIQLRHI